jgi:glutamate racemase
MANNSRIGVYDSGVGGLSVLKELKQALPRERFLYLADTARVPYGNKSREEIIRINKEILDYFSKKFMKMVIIACGTSSAIAYPIFKNAYKFPLVSLIEPGANAAIQATRNGKIGLLATEGTVNSGAYQDAIMMLKGDAQTFSVACPAFVPLIEAGNLNSIEMKASVKEYLAPLLQNGVDTIILGCTHYPHIKKLIQEAAGSGVTLIDPAQGAAALAREIITRRQELNFVNLQDNWDEFVVTGSPNTFQSIGSRLLGREIPAVEQIIL